MLRKFMNTLIVNNKKIKTDLPVGTVVLDFLRSHLKLMGTKEGCREGDCGACMVLLGELKDSEVYYKPVNSCLLPLGDVVGKHIVTIEGINRDELNTLQNIFIEQVASQCGFCTPGILISLIGFLLNADQLENDQAISYIAGNICRCTGYASIKRSVDLICKAFNSSNFSKTKQGLDRIKLLIKWKLLPEYFSSIQKDLQNIKNNIPQSETKNPVLVAGGTDLFVQKADKLLESDLKFVSQIENLKNIKIEGDKCIIGAGVVTEDIKQSEIIQKHIPEIKDFIELISSTPIRYRATIAGNIVNASPIGDMSIILLALGAEVVLDNGKRTIPLKDFYKGYKQLDKKEEEIIHSFVYKVPDDNYVFNFEKVSKRKNLDIASVNTAIQIAVYDGIIKHVNISAGGVGPIPLYLQKTCDYLLEKELKEQTIEQALTIALTEISPISDVRGSKEYKSLLLKQLIYSHFMFVIARSECDVAI